MPVCESIAGYKERLSEMEIKILIKVVLVSFIAFFLISGEAHWKKRKVQNADLNLHF